MVKAPTKTDITKAFKDFENSLSILCEVVKNDMDGNKYVDQVFSSTGEDPFTILTMEQQVENVKGWVEFLESEIKKI